MEIFKPVGKAYNILQKNFYWKVYYKKFGNPFIHYHVCFRYFQKYVHTKLERAKVLDLGCGDGTYINELAYKYQITGYGVDNMPNRINQASQVAESLKSRLKFSVDDITTNPKINGKFDLGICFDVLEHLETSQVDAVLKICAKHIKPGGILVIRVPYGNDQKYIGKPQKFTYGKDEHKVAGFTFKRIKKLLGKYGFEIDIVKFQFYWLAQINYEISEMIRSYSKVLYSVYSLLFRWVSFIEIYTPILSFGRKNGMMIVSRRIR